MCTSSTPSSVISNGDEKRARQAADDIARDDLECRHRRDQQLLNRVHESPLEDRARTFAVRRVDDLEHDQSRDQELRVRYSLDAGDSAAQANAEDEDVEQRRDDRRPDHLIDDLETADDLTLDERPKADRVQLRIISRKTSCSEAPSATSSSVGFSVTIRPSRMIAMRRQSSSASSR